MATARITHVLMGQNSAGEPCLIGYDIPERKYSTAIIYRELFPDFAVASNTPDAIDLKPIPFLNAGVTAQEAQAQALRLNRPVYINLIEDDNRNKKTAASIVIPGELKNGETKTHTTEKVNQPIGFIGAATFIIDATVREWLDKKIRHIRDADRRQEAAHMYLAALYCIRYVYGSVPEEGINLIKLLDNHYGERDEHHN